MPTLSEPTANSYSTDAALLAAIAQKNHRTLQNHAGVTFQNSVVARYAHESYTAQQLNKLAALLDEKKVLAIPILRGYSVAVDGKRRPVSIVAATDINDSHHGEMSSMIYLRDHIQTASAYMKLHLHDPKQYAQEGRVARELLLSALHLMSTSAQLARFDTMIKKGSSATQEEWPHISLYFSDLEATQPNGWRNKQDTFQMLAYLALDAIQRGFLTVTDLLPSHKKFLSSIVPTLQSVGFPHYESSGSWEEITAVRTSVTAIETALLSKLSALFHDSDTYDFLRGTISRTAFSQMLDNLTHKGLIAIGKALPNESPDYDPRSIKFREADAALAYVLLYDLPALLAKAAIPITNRAIVMTEWQIETLVLQQLETLSDPITGGITRYKDDSYQRVNFHTNEVQATIKTIKQQVNDEATAEQREVDLDKKQQLRHDRTPQGRLAAWTHPLGQIASWAALKSIQAADTETRAKYTRIGTRFLNRTLATITGEDTWNTELMANGQYAIRVVPAFKLPECYITYDSPVYGQTVTPSPHTPLNWSTAMAKQTIGLLRISIAARN